MAHKLDPGKINISNVYYFNPQGENITLGKGQTIEVGGNITVEGYRIITRKKQANSKPLLLDEKELFKIIGILVTEMARLHADSARGNSKKITALNTTIKKLEYYNKQRDSTYEKVANELNQLDINLLKVQKIHPMFHKSKTTRLVRDLSQKSRSAVYNAKKIADKTKTDIPEIPRMKH